MFVFSNRQRLDFHYGRSVVGALLLCLNATISDGEQVRAKQGTYQPADVQTDVSKIYVFVEKVGIGHQHGVEARLSRSTLRLGADKDAGKLVFDMKSFDADTPAARKYVGLSGTTDASTRSAVNENMRGPGVLDVNKYPTATFEIVSAKPTGQKGSRNLPVYRLEGLFTLHGTTQPLTVLVDVEQARGWLHLRGNFTIQQTSYRITPFSKAFGAIGVGNELKIYGDLFVAPTEQVVLADIPVHR